jgi:hypothetical protein
MAISRVKTWISGEVLTASDLNAEFNNILSNATSLISPATGTWDLNANEFILDGDADTSITADTDDQIDFKVGCTDHLRVTAAGMGITATNRFYWDGVAMTGNTYTHESVNDTVVTVVGGTTTLQLKTSEVTILGHLLFTDDTFDIGASGATRPRNIFLSDDAFANGNISIGGSAARSSTAGTHRLDIFDGVAPVGTLANGVSFYSTSGECRVMDAAGNATLLSPHDRETNEWIFDSVETMTGRKLRIDVERLLREVNEYLGLDCVHDSAD